jgi:hypothetical protein
MDERKIQGTLQNRTKRGLKKSSFFLKKHLTNAELCDIIKTTKKER